MPAGYPPHQQPPPAPKAGRKRRGPLVIGIVVAVVALVAAVVIVVVGFSGGDPEPQAKAKGPADSYAEAPKCDGFSPEVRESLPDDDASLNQPMAGTAGGAGYRCLWITSGTEVMVTTETLTAADGRTGAARAAEWVRDLPGDPLTAPKIGDAAKLDPAQCNLTFHLSNLVVDIIGGKPGSCRQRLTQLARDYADTNKR